MFYFLQASLQQIQVFLPADQETFKKVLSEVDIAISTAAIPGRWG